MSNDDTRLLGLLAFNQGMVPYFKMKTNERQAWRQVKGGVYLGFSLGVHYLLRRLAQ